MSLLAIISIVVVSAAALFVLLVLSVKVLVWWMVYRMKRLRETTGQLGKGH